MNFKNIRAALLVATIVGMPFAATNATATTVSCAACVVGTAPNTAIHTGVNANKTACSTCHTASTVGGTKPTTGKPTTGKKKKFKRPAATPMASEVSATASMSASKSMSESESETDD